MANRISPASTCLTAAAATTASEHEQDFLTPAGRGIIVDPPDGTLPMQPWAQAEVKSRLLPERGYEDPTAHCFVAGTSRSMYVPAPLHILQPLATWSSSTSACRGAAFRSTAARSSPTRCDSGRRPVGKWDGDTLVVETRNLNGKTWLNEVGEIVPRRARDRAIPADQRRPHQLSGDRLDPLVYTRPWTIAFALNRQKEELLEVACHEDNQDLQHLKESGRGAPKRGPLLRGNHGTRTVHGHHRIAHGTHGGLGGCASFVLGRVRLEQPIKQTGKVIEMRWSNPHAWIYINVTGKDGKVVKWA